MSVEINILPITLTSYFQCNHPLTGVLPQIATNSVEYPLPTGKPPSLITAKIKTIQRNFSYSSQEKHEFLEN